MKFKIKNYFKNKIVLITGGTGTIGSALALELLNYKCKAVRVLSNDENGLYELFERVKISTKIIIQIILMLICSKLKIRYF